MKIRLTLETDMKKMFESDKNHTQVKNSKDSNSTDPSDKVRTANTRHKF